MGERQTQQTQLFKAQFQNRRTFARIVQQSRGNNQIEQYQQAVRQIFFNEGLFQSKKSRQMLQKYLQQLNPSLHYSEQVQLMLRNVGKIFLIQLFQKAIQIRDKMVNKKEIDQEVLEEAYRRMSKS